MACRHDIATVVESARKLFVDRPDFLERFSEYLPAASGAAAASDARQDTSESAVVSKSTKEEPAKQRSGKKPAISFSNALEYLEQVKSRCPPGDYSVFLDIMKDFKAQKCASSLLALIL